jgi:hypothetical protein
MKRVHYVEKPVVLVSPAKVAENEYQRLFEAQGINIKIDYFGN